MRFLAFIAWLALAGVATAQVPMTGAGVGAPGGGGGPCSQYTAFIARTSGTTTTEKSVYQTMICGMVTDGDWAKLDALWFFPTNTTTSANLNLVSTSFGLTQNGSVTFTADHGYTGDGSTGFFDTGYAAASAGGNLTQNSATAGCYSLSSRTTPQAWVNMRVTDTFENIFIAPNFTGGTSLFSLNDASGTSASATNGSGMWIMQRSAVNSIQAYRNGSSISTASVATAGLPSVNLYLLAANIVSSSPIQFTGDQIGACFVGSGSISQANITARINAAMTTFGINTF